MMLKIARGRTAIALVVLALVGCGKPSADEHAQKGDAYMKDARLPEAILEYRLAIQADPQRGDVRLKLADASMTTGDAAAALREYVRGADLLPTDARAQLKAGQLLLLTGGFEDAKTRATRALELDPKSSDAAILLGNALAGLKDWDAAISEYQEALVLNPGEDAAYVNIGAVQSLRGQGDRAEASFRKAIEIAPRSVRARMAYASFLWSAGRAPQAEETLKEAVTLEPSNVEANRALGTFYLASNRSKEAEPYFRNIAETSKTAETRLNLADYYVMTARPEEATTILNELASQDASYATASTRLAVIDATRGNRTAALTRLRDVLIKHPKDMPARLVTARLLLLEGKRDDAMAQARSIVEEEPSAPAAAGAYLIIGRVEASYDRPDDAIRAFEEVLKRQAQPMDAALALATLYMARGQFDKAGTYSRQALSIGPRYPPARAVAIRLALAQGASSKTRADIAALQQEFPRSSTVLNLVAAEQVVNGQLDAAGATYARVVALAPNDFEATTGLVAVDLAKGRKTEAVARVDTLLTSTTPTGAALILAARTYLAVGDAAKAEEFLKRAIDIEPSRLQAYISLAELYVRQRNLAGATTQIQEVVNKSPNSVPANTMLGMLLEMQQQPADAEKRYRTVLRVDPNAPVAANNLAWLLVSGGHNLDEALQLAQTAQRFLPDEPHVNDTLGWIYYRKNLTSLAIEHLERSTRKDATDPSTFYHLGMAYLQAANIDKARSNLRRALAFNRPFDGQADATAAMARLAP